MRDTKGNIHLLLKVTIENMIDGQWRAARALIGWSQADLATKIGASVLTIKRLESDAGSVSDDMKRRAKEALEAAGIEFTNGGQPGVRLKANQDGYASRRGNLPSSASGQEAQMIITGQQAKAARLLLGWTKERLAGETGISATTVAIFESGKRPVAPPSVSKIRRALEAAGVIFVEENGEGPCVRLRKGK